MVSSKNYYGGSSGSGHTPTAEEMRRDFERNLDKGFGQLNSSLEVSAGKDGKYRFLGIEVSKDMGRMISVLRDSLAVPLGSITGEFLYKHGKSIAKYFQATDSRAHAIGLGAEMAARWGIILSKPISTLVNANMGFVSQRKKLYEELRPIAESTGINLSKNEVAEAALRRVGREWSDDMKNLIPDTLPLTMQIIQGLESQKKLSQKRSASLSIDASMEEIEKNVEKELKALEHQWDLHERIAERLAERKAIYRDRQSKKRPDVDVKEFDREFDRMFAPKMRSLEQTLQEKTPAASEGIFNSDNSTLYAITMAASGLSEIFKERMERAVAHRSDRVIAYDMIKHLKGSIDAQCYRRQGKKEGCDPEFVARKPDEIRITGMGEHNNEHLSLKQFIIGVFQQNERDHGRVALGESLIDELMPAVDQIANHIANGTLDPNALIKLVGENQIIIHEGSAKRFASEDQAKVAIAELLGGESTKTTSHEAFIADYNDPEALMKVIKYNMDNLQGKDRASFAYHMPEETLIKLGYSKGNIAELRHEASEYIDRIVASEVLRLAYQDADTLRKNKVSEQSIAAIQELANHILEGDMEAVEVAINGKDKIVMEGVRTAMLKQQISGDAEGEKIWADTVGKATNLEAEVNRLIEEKQSESDRSSRHADQVRPSSKQGAEHYESASERVRRGRRGSDKPSPHTPG